MSMKSTENCLHYIVQHMIKLTLRSPLTSSPLYHKSIWMNDEFAAKSKNRFIKVRLGLDHKSIWENHEACYQIQELIDQGKIRPSSYPCNSLTVLG